MKRLSGTGVAMVTPFNSDHSVDHPSLKKLTRHLIDGGIDVLVALGTTSEAPTLSKEEEYRVVETIKEENQGKLPLVIGCGGNNTAAVTASLQQFEEKFQPDAFLSVNPYYNKPTQEGIYRHFEELSKHSRTPIIAYNVPGRTASNMLPETILSLARDFENIVAVKEASGNIEQCMTLAQNRPEGFLLLSGDDGLLLPQLAVGFDGIISVAGNALPKKMAEIVDLGISGKIVEAREQFYALRTWMDLLFREGNPAGIKASLEHLDICGPATRLPLIQASESLIKDIKKELA